MENDMGASRGRMPFGDDSDSPVSTPPQSPVHPSGPSATHTSHLQYLNKTAPSSTVPAKRKEPSDPNAPTKKPRQKKKTDADGTTPTTQNADGTEKPKEKKPRKPRDPNAPPRKPRKKPEVEGSAKGPVTIVEPHLFPGSATSPHSALYNTAPPSHAPTFAQIGKSEAGKTPIATHHGVTNQTQQQPKHTYTPTPQPVPISRPRYDPIRSASAENAAHPELVNYSSPPARTTPVPTHARASASITNLLSDPTETYISPRPYSATPRQYDTRTSQPPSPATTHTPHTSTAPTTNGYNSMPPPPKPVIDTPKAVEAAKVAAPSKPLPTSMEPTPTPPPAKPKAPRPSKVDTPTHTSSPKTSAPPKAKSPSGLAVIGNGPPTTANLIKPPPPKKERPAVQPVINDCIVIEVPMTAPTGNYCNFMKEVETKYGFEVAYPRVAEHKKRMAHMASLQGALEGAVLTSGDEMNLDDDEMDSNAEMGGMDGGGDSTAAETAAAKKKRRAKANEYDKTDDFIDDAEQAWEEQALASKDGYFVWMGPLVPEEEKDDNEKAGAKGGRGTKGKGKAGDAAGKGGKTPGVSRGSKAAAEPGKRKPRATKAEMEERRAAKAAREAAKEAKEGKEIKEVKDVVMEEAAK